MILEFIKSLHLYYSLAIGILPNNSAVFYGINEYVTDAPKFQTEFCVSVSSPKNRFFVGGSSVLYMTPTEGKPKFTPIQDSFYFNTGIRLAMFEIGYEHFCSHPFALSHNNRAIPRSYYGAYDKFYIKIEGGK